MSSRLGEPQQVEVLAHNIREPYDVLCGLVAFGGRKGTG